MITQLDYQGFLVPMGTSRNKDLWINVTEITRKYGKEPYDWLKQKQTQEYIERLIRRANEKSKPIQNRNAPESEPIPDRYTINDFVKTLKGNSTKFQQGTWIHRKLIIMYARWLDIDFAIWCDEQIETLLTKGTVSLPENKINFLKNVLDSESVIPIRTIALDYGMSAPRFNKLLEDLGIQYRFQDYWIISSKYVDKGYVQTKSFTFQHKTSGENETKCTMYWTQLGRLFLYDKLKDNDILPMQERLEQTRINLPNIKAKAIA